MKNLFYFSTLTIISCLIACSSNQKKSDLKVEMIQEDPTRDTSYECESTKEYITALNYFREEKNLVASEIESRKMALEISKGCDGAANRFIKIANLLLKSNVLGNNAAKSALLFVRRPNRDVNAFIEVFTRCYLEDYLDMSIESSMNIANSLSSQFDGNSKTAVEDFKKVVSFCIDNDQKLQLKKIECGEMAARVARSGQNSKLSVHKAFVDAYEFLHSLKGPNFSVFDSLQMAEKLVAISPKSVSNFKDAYEFAVSRSGLGYALKDAVSFAKNMAEYTGPEVKSEKLDNKSTNKQEIK